MVALAVVEVKALSRASEGFSPAVEKAKAVNAGYAIVSDGNI
jgi:hypothetical protein